MRKHSKARAKGILSALLVASATIFQTGILSTRVSASGTQNVTITIDPTAERKAISPYIYGVNEGIDLSKVTTYSIRQGGNRWTAYNWENNYSNAGSDWYHQSDIYMVSDLSADEQAKAGVCALNLSAKAKANNIPFTLTTLQMAGYVASDAGGPIVSGEEAPSSRWCEVLPQKNAEFTLTPDKTDGVVYMDEYVNYLVSMLGSSQTVDGINAYSLDNEPALWAGTHEKLHSSATTCRELVEKSTALASAVKSVDPDALIFGPALYGFNAYSSLQSATDWEEVKGDYRWFVDYYLDSMRKASENGGARLLDVLDVHYYSEARGTETDNRITDCSDYTHTDCIEARLQAPRTLYDKTYIENSWIGQWGTSFLPILPNLQASINTYYPNTKLAVTEYSFGGGDHISGAVAQADALGAFAKNDVYFASLWHVGEDISYQLSAINLYTNYDGNGSSFGDTLVSAESSDIGLSTVYASTHSDDTDTLNVIITNKSTTQKAKATIKISGSDSYTSADAYGIIEGSSAIRELYKVSRIENNTIIYELEPMSVVELVLHKGVEEITTTTPVVTTEPEPTTTVSETVTEATTTTPESVTTASSEVTSNTESVATEITEPDKPKNIAEDNLSMVKIVLICSGVITLLAMGYLVLREKHKNK